MKALFQFCWIFLKEWETYRFFCFSEIIEGNKHFKVGLLTFHKSVCVICFFESPLKLLKNAFYFTLKALFVLKIFTFLSWLSGHVFRKVNFKIHDVTTWSTNIYCPISQEVKASRQLIEFSQLIEYNIRNIFVEKWYSKRSGETIPRPLSRKTKLSISLDQKCKVLNSVSL